MLRSYFKLALRTLRRQKSYALINGIGFTVGLVCCALVVLFLRHELRYDQFYDRSEDIYRLLRQKRSNWWSTIPLPNYENASAEEQRRLPRALTQQIAPIETATNFWVGHHGEADPMYIEQGDRQFQEDQVLFTTTGPAFLDMFTFEFLRGRPETAFQRPNTAVLTESAARRYFDTLDVLGRTLNVHTPEGTQEVEVRGVIANIPSYSHFEFELALQVNRIPNWGAYTYVRLQPGTNPETLTPNVSSIMAAVRPQRVEDPLLQSVLKGERLQPMTAIHLGPRMLYDQKPHRDVRYLWAFAAIGLLILAIVGINYTNMAVALYAERSREVGVRKAMGAHRSQVAGQFFVEAILLTGLCLPIVVLALEGVVPLFNNVMNVSLQNNFATSPLLLGGLAGLALLVGVTAGSYPALVLSRKKAVALFRNALSGGGHRRWSTRHALIVVQFALLIGLGGVSWLVNQQLHYLQTKDLGFQTQGVIELDNVGSVDNYKQLKSQLQNRPEVQAVGAGIGPGPGRFHVTYRPPNAESVHSDGDYLYVDPGWFKVMGIDHPVVERMSNAGATAPSRFLINRAAARVLDYDEPVDRTVVIAPDSRNPERQEIHGIVDNFNLRPLYEHVQPTFLHVVPEPQQIRSMLVRVDPHNLGTAMDQLRAAWNRVRPDHPFSPQFIEDRLAQLYEEEQRAGMLGVGLTGIAFLLAILGLVGLSAYITQRRTKEIGVRKALGATVTNIVMHLNKEFVALVGIALVVAAPVAYWAARQWLQIFAYRIGINPLIFLGAGVVALTAALSAVSYQAWQAARINPADALSTE